MTRNHSREEAPDQDKTSPHLLPAAPEFRITAELVSISPEAMASWRPVQYLPLNWVVVHVKCLSVL
jgi:hypothetical protein